MHWHNMKTARKEILQNLKTAIHEVPEKPDFDASVYHPIEEPLEIVFKDNLEKVNGHVHLFSSEQKLFTKLHSLLSNVDKESIFCYEEDLANKLLKFDISFTTNTQLQENIQVGITGCEFLIAHTGSVMVSSAQKGGRQMFVYPPVHIIVAFKKQLVSYLEQAYTEIQKKYNEDLPSQITLITGPSRTADIEKTLILGAHGPKELHVLISE